MIEADIYVTLVYTGDVLPGIRAVSFIRRLSLPFPPAVGMRLLLSSKPLAAAGLGGDPLDLTVADVSWWEDDNSIGVVCEYVEMGAPQEAAEDARWMMVQGFKPEGGPRR